MAYQVPNCEPSSVVAGDLLTWTRSFSDFPSNDGWALTYSIVKLGDSNAPIAITSTASGQGFLVSVNTTGWPEGEYVGQGFVTKGSERHLVWNGKIIVQPNFSTSQLPDQRSDARKIVDFVNANMLGVSQGKVVSCEIEGSKMEFRKVEELLALRNYYGSIAAGEDAKLTGKNRRIMLSKFTKPI